MLKKLAKKIFLSIADKPLPTPSSEELVFLSDLLDTFRGLQDWDAVGESSSETWRHFGDRLNELLHNKDPREFLRWDVITQTMFIYYASYIRRELRHLKQNPSWNTRWQPAIKESWVGNPTPYIFFPNSSANLIHHAYHLAQFEEWTNSDVSDTSLVVEFGAGYGSMCRLFHNLGFHGKYITFDLPHFSALQTYYLKTLGLSVLSETEFLDAESGVVCLSDIEQLRSLLAKQVDFRKSMFVATWSISECPIGLRDSFLPLVSEFDSFLVAYQEKFETYNNLDFFDQWIRSLNGINWSKRKIEHQPSDHYLLGKRQGS